MGSDGHRLVWSADSMMVIYSLKGKFYGQSARGFALAASPMKSEPLQSSKVRRAQLMAKVAEVEMTFLMGIVAGSSGVGFAMVIGVEVHGNWPPPGHLSPSRDTSLPRTPIDDNKGQDLNIEHAPLFQPRRMTSVCVASFHRFASFQSRGIAGEV
jgi:hypothetical protein